MAYNKVSNKHQNRDVKYLSKDFNTYKSQLLDFAETYFPNTFNDFSEGNPSMMFLEMAAYVGDVLSFYTDTQIQETFLMLAQDRDNLFNLAYAMGYKPKVISAAAVDLDISQLVPSKQNNNDAYVPDYDYALKIMKSSTVQSTEGPTFYLTEDVDFNFSSSLSNVTASIYQYDANNNPEYYLLTKKVPAISAEPARQTFSIGTPEKFKSISLNDKNIISIESVVDTEGNEWHEVPYLAQDTIFDEVPNNAANDPELHQYSNQTPYLLKIKEVPRRFITRVRPNDKLEMQFGAGTNALSDEQIIPNPDNVGLGIKDGLSKLDKTYDPSNFLYTKTYGTAPSNTTLTVNYLRGGGIRSNVSSNTIVKLGEMRIKSNPGINQGMLNFVKSNLTATNIHPARGGGDGDSNDDLRLNTIANYSTQGRTVTKEDYIVRTLMMPPRFGSIAKAYITQDDQISPLTTEPNRIPNPLAMNLYILGYTKKRKLTTLNKATKVNLRNYLDQFRTMTDAVNIKNAFVINISVDFEITTYKNYSNQETILDCINELRSFFHIDKWQINQPIITSEVMNVIGAVKGVQTVERVMFKNQNDTSKGYSQYSYGIDSATKDGVIYPSLNPSIFELKFPNRDIKGRIITY